MSISEFDRAVADGGMRLASEALADDAKVERGLKRFLDYLEREQRDRLARINRELHSEIP